MMIACVTRGALYYTSHGLDAADYRALSHGIAILRQIEDLIIIIDGRPLTGATCDDTSVHLGGVALADRAVLLVSNYDAPAGTTATVMLPMGFRDEARELTPSGPKSAAVRDGVLRVTFGPERARAYLLGR